MIKLWISNLALKTKFLFASLFGTTWANNDLRKIAGNAIDQNYLVH